MKPLNWKQSDAVGIESIDRQHQHIFDLHNSLRVVLLDGSARRHVDELLSDLIRLMTIHFSTEEAEMEELGWPGLDDHRKLHEELRSELAAMVMKINEGDKVGLGGTQAAQAMRDWIASHVSEHMKDEDRKFADWYAGQRSQQAAPSDPGQAAPPEDEQAVSSNAESTTPELQPGS